MNNRPKNLIRLLALLAGGAFLHSAHAAKPQILEREALVKEINEECDLPAPHCHQIETKWELVKDVTTFEVNAKWWRLDDVYFFDLPWFGNEMQSADLHLIHGEKPPLSKDNFTNLGSWPVKIDDFLFLFGIDNLENADKTSSPHALIYVPYRVFNHGQDQGYFFRLYVVHIPETAVGCPNEKKVIEQLLCDKLVGLQEKWLAGASAKVLNDQAHIAARELLPRVFEGLGSPGDTSVVDGDPIALVFAWIYGFGLHNGIIHGNLGGG